MHQKFALPIRLRILPRFHCAFAGVYASGVLKTSQSAHYVDNNSTPTMVSNLLEAKYSLFESTSHGTPCRPHGCYVRQSSIPPPVMRDNHSYRRQYPLLTLAASAVLSGVRRQKEC